MNEPSVETPAAPVPAWRQVVDDVLAQLPFLTVRKGRYISFTEYDVAGRLSRVWDAIRAQDGDLQPLVDDVQKHCRVCLLGACVLSKARVMDQVPIRQVFTDTGGDNLGTRESAALLAGVFDPADVPLMESAFECDPFFAINTAPADEDDDEHARRCETAYGAAVFGLQAGGPMSRVRAVMRNIVENDGRFVPPPMASDEYTREWREKVRGFHD